MANTLLTPTAVTRRALAILHQKLNFVGKVNRQYDDSFAVSGAKIGDSLRIRLPNKYIVSDGAALVEQDTVEQSVTLQVSNQKHVGMNFTSVDLTLDIDDFASRIIEPAMSVLAAKVEADALTMSADVYQTVYNESATMTANDALKMNQKITDGLSPYSNRCLNLNTNDNVSLVTDNKGLFNPQSNISGQFREGMVQNQYFGFAEVYENTLHPNQAAGSGSGYVVNGAAQTGASLTVGTGTGNLVKGQTFTIADVNRVHPETKEDTGVLQQFVVTEDYAGGAGDISIAPEIVTSTGRQTVNQSPANGAALTFEQSESSSFQSSLGFHRDAFTFATADLVLPDGVDFAAREVYDGISLRVIRQYDINNDKFPARVDVLYGYKTMRAEQASRGIFKPN